MKIQILKVDYLLRNTNVRLDKNTQGEKCNIFDAKVSGE